MMRKLVGLVRSCFVLGILFSQTVLAQEVMPDYYYKNVPPKAPKGFSFDLSPFTTMVNGIRPMYKPTFFDFSIAYNAGVLLENYKAVFDPEFQFYFNYAAHTPSADTFYLAQLQNKSLNDYGSLVLQNWKMYRGGMNVTLWVRSKTKWQAGPHLGVSVGRYSYSYDYTSATDTLIGTMNREFIAFSPGFSLAYQYKPNLRFYSQLSYNQFFETDKRNKELGAVHPDFTRKMGSFTPRFGLVYLFKTK